MGVRFLQYLSAGIISILSFTSLSYAQQIMLPQPLITPPGVSARNTRHFPAYRIGGPATPIAPMSAKTLEPSVFPLFIEDNEISSLVTLVNSSGVSSSALLTIRDQMGTTYPAVAIPVVAHAKVQIKVADLLQKIGAQVRVGSILVTQGPELTRPSILGQLTLAETTAAPVALTEEELVMPMLVDSQDLRSISESATDAQLIAVTSLSTEPQHITAQCYKKAGITTKTATIAPGGTALLYPCSKDSSQFEGVSLLGSSETTDSAGISIHSDGPNGGFAAFGLARHISPTTKSTFLGSLQFIDPTSLHSSALVFTGVSAGYSLTPGAYPYSAAVALANFSTQASHITIAFHKNGVNGSVSTTTQNIALTPQSSTQVPLGQLGLKAGEIGSLIVSSDQQPGDLMAKIVSSSDSAPNQLEQLAKDAADEHNGGAHPWTFQDNARSDLVLFNHSSRTEPFNILITTEDGTQWTQQLKLAPFETRTVSINDLIKNKIVDSRGRTLPATAWSGTVVWHTGGPGIGTGHVLIRNEANATGESFSCTGMWSLCGATINLWPDQFFGVGDLGTAWVMANICVDWQGGTCDGDFSYSGSPQYVNPWSSTDPNVMSVTSSGSQANLQANALGNTDLEVDIYDQYFCSASGFAPVKVGAPMALVGSSCDYSRGPATFRLNGNWEATPFGPNSCRLPDYIDIAIPNGGLCSESCFVTNPDSNGKSTRYCTKESTRYADRGDTYCTKFNDNYPVSVQ